MGRGGSSRAEHLHVNHHTRTGVERICGEGEVAVDGRTVVEDEISAATDVLVEVGV